MGDGQARQLLTFHFRMSYVRMPLYHHGIWYMAHVWAFKCVYVDCHVAPLVMMNDIDAACSLLLLCIALATGSLKFGISGWGLGLGLGSGLVNVTIQMADCGLK
jgi:hypothetical protein